MLPIMNQLFGVQGTAGGAQDPMAQGMDQQIQDLIRSIGQVSPPPGQVEKKRPGIGEILLGLAAAFAAKQAPGAGQPVAQHLLQRREQDRDERQQRQDADFQRQERSRLTRQGLQLEELQGQRATSQDRAREERGAAQRREEIEFRATQREEADKAAREFTEAQNSLDRQLQRDLARDERELRIGLAELRGGTDPPSALQVKTALAVADEMSRQINGGQTPQGDTTPGLAETLMADPDPVGLAERSLRELVTDLKDQVGVGALTQQQAQALIDSQVTKIEKLLSDALIARVSDLPGFRLDSKTLRGLRELDPAAVAQAEQAIKDATTTAARQPQESMIETQERRRRQAREQFPDLPSGLLGGIGGP